MEKYSGPLSPQEKQTAMNAAVRAGRILLENGAEIGRVEDTIHRIFRYYGIDSASTFVIVKGIFATLGEAGETSYANVQEIYIGSARFNKIAAINQLSREIMEGRHSLNDLDRCMDEIERMPGKRNSVQCLSAGIGSAAFCYVLGGSLLDCAAIVIAASAVYTYLLYFGWPKLSKFMGYISGGAIGTFLCALLYSLGFGDEMSFMVAGAILPMVPGVSIINAIRDIASGFSMSGPIRMVDALMVFFAIALGVSFALAVCFKLTGGVLL